MPAPTTITSFPIGPISGITTYCYVEDVTNGYVLYTKNPDTVFTNPASLTKLMTVLLVYEYHGPSGANDLSSGTVTFTTADVTNTTGFTLDSAGFAAGDVTTWEGLLYAALLPSSFEACQCAARIIGDAVYAAAGNTGTQGMTRFVEVMNARAAALGMTNTTYTDPFGDSDHGATHHNTSSARDIGKIAKTVLTTAALQTIAGTTTYSLAVTGSSPRTLTLASYNVFTNGPGFNTTRSDATRKQIKDGHYLAGKDGGWNDGSANHHSHAGLWSTPNSSVLIVTLNASSQQGMNFDQRGMYYQLSKDFAYLWYGAGKTGDASFGSVKWLLGFEGSTTDESSAAHTQTNNSVTTAGAVVIDSGTNPPGSTASAVFNAQSDYVKSASHADFQPGSGDFTAEMWYAGDGVDPSTTEYVFLAKWDNNINAREWLFEWAGSQLSMYYSSAGNNNSSINFASFSADERSTFFNGAPRYMAFVKSGSNIYFYVNGERNPSATGSLGTIFSGAADVSVGLSFTAASMKGFADEVRITKGVARYSAEVITVTPQTWPRSATDVPALSTAPPVNYSRLAVAAAAGPGPHLAIGLHPQVAAFSRGRTTVLANVVNPAGSVTVPAGASQVFMPAFTFQVPIPGPWRHFKNTPPAFTELWLFPSGLAAVTVPPDVYMPAVTAAIPLRGPWNHFRPSIGMANPSAGVGNPPVPPGVSPPPPPPPQTGVLGPARSEVLPWIPRAPKAADERVRPHIDKVTVLLNSLIRGGFIRIVGQSEYAIVGGGFALPRAPAATDDVTVGAVVGGTFVDTTTNDVYVCVVNDVNSAVWRKVT